ncbi:hypothetical protein IMZ48_39445 [Candidatus Bathyarchaeota archaeon]|nr:hypothetical protein [Candidatus Bathyarchaeota archaeon]
MDETVKTGREREERKDIAEGRREGTYLERPTSSATSTRSLFRCARSQALDEAIVFRVRVPCPG